MSFDFASAKATARRAVQAAFGVQAFYSDASITVPVEIRARWHNRISKPFGSLQDGDGYAEIIEGIDRIALIPDEYDDGVRTGHTVTLKAKGIVTFPTMLPGVQFILDYREPHTGPLEEAWAVTRK